MTSRKVIVFGPTGAVGSAAARTAEELGADVVLALRDTAKPVRGLDAAKEKQGRFERVYADLTKPDTVRDAVQTTQAKHAFIYWAHGTPDHQKSSIEALKAAGIELVVFLSSFTVQGDLKAIQPDDVISYIHAQIEINLEEVFGKDGFVALRPGSFASNNAQFKAGLEKGEVKVYQPDATIDNIVPEDIGRVAGTILAKGPPQDGQKIIFLFGPKLLSQADTVKTIAKVLGKNPKIESANAEEAYEIFLQRGVPAPLAKYMVSQTGKVLTGPGIQVFGFPGKEEYLHNVERYSGTKATTVEEWAEQNKHVFLS
ncbi:hypothetical protein A1O3_05487 [Capronia epimyces CBS 606.96]|uniref:NmrA-like domain-containing protein n=1 Tax=Capronia epimyces CBS 606.96 TaxID=1182542 RepID=W9YRB6_9EURO|nr:uncharacterized protein A1O3_05487 [Capronia epimyces CBS 606.96]EXJ84814.1 hypothetical protein A1O3_05487 [Capronia epimyces CBS 606.96]